MPIPPPGAALFKQYAERPKFELPPFRTTNKESYHACLSPMEALERYQLDARLAVVQLMRNLLADRVQAVADEARWNDGDEYGRTQFAIIPHWIWRTIKPEVESDFWLTGYLETYFPGEPYNSHRWAELFEVRFWPDGLPPPPPEEADTSRTSPLPEAEQRRFCELYLGTWKDAAYEGKALSAIRACYPDKAISRDPFFVIFRELRGPGKRGKPPNRGK